VGDGEMERRRDGEMGEIDDDIEIRK